MNETLPHSFSLKIWIVPIFITSLCIHLCTAYFSDGFYHPDEQNYVLDYAQKKWSGQEKSLMALENPTHSWAMPGFYFGLKKIIKYFNNDLELNPFKQAQVFRLLSAFLSFLCMFFFVVRTFPFLKKDNYKLLYLLLSQFLWFIPFMMARTSQENISFAFFALGLGLSLNPKLLQKPHIFTWLITGIFMGISFVSNYVLGITILFYAIWFFFFRTLSIYSFFTWLIGFLVVLSGNIIIDFWGYNSWDFTLVNFIKQYLNTNSIQSISNSQWWYYLKLASIKGIPPFSYFFMALITIFWIRNSKHLFTWITFPSVCILSVLSPKEFRFIFPIILFGPLLISISLEQLNIGGNFWKNKIIKFFIKTSIVFNCFILGALVIKPAYAPIKIYEYIYHHLAIGTPIHVLEKKYKSDINLEYSFYKKGEYPIIKHKIKKDLQHIQGYALSNKFHDTNYIYKKTKCQVVESTYPMWLYKYKAERLLGKVDLMVLWKCP